MTLRTDITVDWTQSPRLIFVGAPSTQLTIQDLHDTLRVLEERPWEGLTHPHIIETAGKEELGGSVTVGLTAKLLNARLAFEARKDSTSAGSITTPDATGVTLIDSTATFITDSIEPGAWVINTTDGSKATVLKVTSQTQLITDGLGDGIDNQFNTADLYEIQNITLCEVSGGNLVAVTSDGVTALVAILPTAGTQVVRTSSSSATLQELQDIQFSSFSDAVTVDLLSSYSGVTYPTGTPRQPVNNFTDAATIAASRGFTVFHIKGNATIDGNFTSKIFKGQSINKTIITIDAAAQVSGCEIINATVLGTLDGDLRIIDCEVGNITYVDGLIDSCGLTGTIELSGSNTGILIDCWDGTTGLAPPVIDCGSGTDLIIRNYNGALNLINKTGADRVSIDLNSGKVTLDSTITNGIFTIRGVGQLVNNSTGTTIDSNLVATKKDVNNAHIIFGG